MQRAERINPFPTAMDFGAGKTVTYSNKVAPTARIYLHLICRKRHLPLNGKTKGHSGKLLCRADVAREFPGLLRSSEPGKNSAPH